MTGSGVYAYPPLLEAIARKQNVTADCVVETMGTSMANHIAMAALIDPGDEVIIEHPTYELLLSTAQYLGADVQRFRKRFEAGFLIDCYELRRAVTSKTELILIPNLQNPL